MGESLVMRTRHLNRTHEERAPPPTTEDFNKRISSGLTKGTGRKTREARAVLTWRNIAGKGLVFYIQRLSPLFSNLPHRRVHRMPS